jgi:glutamyl-Q tRNA(Asp) synthetase
MGLLYPSLMTRAETARLIRETEAAGGTWPRDPDNAPLPDPAERNRPPETAAERIEAGEPYALRLRMDEAARRTGALTWTELGQGAERQIAADPLAWGDVVLARKETPTSYHLSVVVDDALQGVTDIVRGDDLFAATSVHRVLQALLGLGAPRYRHHRLIRDEAGRKLSKSRRDTGLAELRAAGMTPADIRRLTGIDADLSRLAP